MSVVEVSKLSLREKLQVMEAIWDDLRQRVDQLDVPQAHRDLLEARRKRASSGDAAVHEWDEVKHTLGRQ